MNEPSDPQPATPPAGEPPFVVPIRYPAPAAAPRPSGFAVVAWLFRAALTFVLVVSLGFNLLFLLLAWAGSRMAESGDADGNAVVEKFYSGTAGAADKIAVVKLDGVIMEGALGFVHKEIERAAADDRVKAVVLRINSPGGSVTASDDLYRRLRELVDGKSATNPKANKKTLVVSMASMAASGGYYAAMPAEKILAEKTTITGSIGVYVSMPNVAKWSKDYGIGITTIKAGDVKASGSMFREMTPQERQVWQDMIDNNYDRFIEVVETGRPKLKGKLKRDNPVVTREIDGDDGQKVKYVRYLADGGIYSADAALEYGLIDKVGTLDDAILVAKEQTSGLGDYKVVAYERPPTLLGVLVGAQASSPTVPFDPAALSAGMTPRLWYMAPQSEFAGVLAAMRRD